jgi:hypothetical protein
MPAKSIRAPNSFVLIAAGTALLLFAELGTRAAVMSANHYVPVMALAGGPIIDAILGISLLFAGLRQSQFAGVAAVIVATLIIFSLALKYFGWLVFGAPARVSWWTAIEVALVAGILWPSIFPWSWSANKPVLLWAGLTFGAQTLLLGTIILLARLS